MGLINLQTDLKSLRFGNDRVHSGNSGQPYIQTPIPEGESSILPSYDFVLRGGLYAVRDTAEDVLRLSKYFTDLRSPSGLLFIAKQNLLSRTAVSTQSSKGPLNEGIYTPLSTLAQASVSAFGLHFNKQGLNPIPGTPGSLITYNNVVTQFQPNDQNRLVTIYKTKQKNPSFASSLDPVNVRTYPGGPGSILGVGKTNIKFADQRTGEASGHNLKTWLVGNKNGDGAIGSDTNRNDIPLDYRNALGLSVSSSYHENGNLDLPIIKLNKYAGVVGEVGGAVPYYVGKNTNITIGNLIGDSVNVYQRYGHNVDINYRNALGLSVSSSYYENGNSSLPIIDLSTQKNTGISEDGVGVGTYYVGVPGQPSNITIGNLIGNNARTYQALKHNVINVFDNYKKFLGVSKLYVTPILDSEMKTLNPKANLYPPSTLAYSQNNIENIPKGVSTGESTLTGKWGSTNVTGDFRALLRKSPNGSSPLGLAALAPNYTTENIEQRVGLGTPGDTKSKNLLNYANGSNPGKVVGYSGGNASSTSYDIINALPIYSSNTGVDTDYGNDLVKFRIGVINNDVPSAKTYIHFRAFLNNISDGYTSDWQDTRYIGRGEKFYNYSGFDRKVSLSWTVAAQSKAELIPMYKKLNYLASVCAPDYSSQGYMRGNIVTLTIGGYFYEQPGIITGFSYEMNDDNATWEIGINSEGGDDDTVKELPHLIKVSGFNFIPIHTFVPRLQQNSYDPTGNVLTDLNQYGPERYIALENKGAINGPASDTNNYGPIYVTPRGGDFGGGGAGGKW